MVQVLSVRQIADLYSGGFCELQCTTGSVLGPIEFIAYSEDVTELIAAYELSYHLLVDDKQLYTAVGPSEVPAGCQRLVSCISDLHSGVRLDGCS